MSYAERNDLSYKFVISGPDFAERQFIVGEMRFSAFLRLRASYSNNRRR